MLIYTLACTYISVHKYIYIDIDKDMKVDIDIDIDKLQTEPFRPTWPHQCSADEQDGEAYII